MSERSDPNSVGTEEVLLLLQKLLEGQRSFFHALRSPLSVIAGCFEDLNAGITLDDQSKADGDVALQRTLALLQEHSPPEIPLTLSIEQFKDAVQTRFLFDREISLSRLNRNLSESERALLFILLELVAKQITTAANTTALLGLEFEQEEIRLTLRVQERPGVSPQQLNETEQVLFELSRRALRAEVIHRLIRGQGAEAQLRVPVPHD